MKIGTFVTGYPGSYFEGTIWQIVSICTPGFGITPIADISTLVLLGDPDRKYAVPSDLIEFTEKDLSDIHKEALAKVKNCESRLQEWFGAGACPKT